MKTLLTLLLVGISLTLHAQIRQLEYGWDTDKGHGLNTLVAVTSTGTGADVNLTVPMTGLANGYHMLFVRTRDANNRWSHTYLRLVNVRAGAVPAKIVQLDYAYSQAGTLVGQYTYRVPTPAATVDLTVPGDLSQLVAGRTYTLSIWATDENGARSQVYSQAFTYRSVDCKGLAVAINGIDKFCTGGNTVLSAAVSGGNTPVALSWSRTGSELAKTASLTALQGGTYTVKATDAQGCVATASLTVTENTNLPSISIGGATSFCAGQSTNLTAITTGGTSPYTYAWRQSGASVGTSAGTLPVNAGGTYAVSVTDASGCASTSATTTVTQRPSPTATLTASAPGVIGGSSVTLTANTGTGLTYQWTRDGQPIAGATQATYTTPQPGMYAVVVSLNGCSATAQATAVSVITAVEEPQSGPDFTLSASPNPGAGVVQVRIITQPGRTVAVTLSVRDLTGRSLYQKQISVSGQHTEQLDLLAQPAAIYLLNAASEGQQTSLRLLRQ